MMRGRALAMSLVAVLGATLATEPLRAQFAEGRTESVTRVRAGDILPPSVQRGADYRVIDDVRVVDNLFEFTLETDAGLDTVRSRALLDVRVFEADVLGQATAQLEQRDNRPKTELRGRLEVRGNNVEEILTSPFSTASSLAGQLGRNVADTLGKGGRSRSGQRSAPDGVVTSRDPIAEAHRRTVASQLGLDVYSGNRAVQAFLDRVALERQAGRVSAGTGLITAQPPARIAVDGGRLDREIENLVRRLDAVELDAAVAAELRPMGASVAEADAFMHNGALTPRHRLTMAAYLDYVGAVPGRAGLIAAAAGSRNESEAVAWRDTTVMYARRTEVFGRLARIDSELGLPVATSADGRLVLALAVDLLAWDEDTVRLADRLIGLAKSRGATGVELLLSGTVTPRAASGLASHGVEVRERYLRP